MKTPATKIIKFSEFRKTCKHGTGFAAASKPKATSYYCRHTARMKIPNIPVLAAHLLSCRRDVCPEWKKLKCRTNAILD